MRGDGALLLDEIPLEEPQARPFQTPLKLGDPNDPGPRHLQVTFPSHKTSCKMGKAMKGDGRQTGNHALNNTRIVFNCQQSIKSE